MNFDDLKKKHGSKLAEQRSISEQKEREASDELDRFKQALPVVTATIIEAAQEAAKTLKELGLRATVSQNTEIKDRNRSVQVGNARKSIVELSFTVPTPPNWTRDTPVFMGMTPVIFVHPFMRPYIEMYATDPKHNSPNVGYVLCGRFVLDAITDGTMRSELAALVDTILSNQAITGMRDV